MMSHCSMGPVPFVIPSPLWKLDIYNHVSDDYTCTPIDYVPRGLSTWAGHVTEPNYIITCFLSGQGVLSSFLLGPQSITK